MSNEKSGQNSPNDDILIEKEDPDDFFSSLDINLDIVSGNNVDSSNGSKNSKKQSKLLKENSSSQIDVPSSRGKSSSAGWKYYTEEENSFVEKKTHHKLNENKINTIIYPKNIPIREYQKNIVKNSLFENTLVALPTGLGKTLIASVVMLNWYRWTEDSKIIFCAPTRPLVIQQAEACYKIVGIPKDDTAVLIGNCAKKSFREIVYNLKRVFFMTPQLLENDLNSGILDPMSIVCVVIDEAHKATGRHSNVNAVKKIHNVNNSLRVLALTATPGSKIENVQDVISNLFISNIEMRTEQSMDVIPYLYNKTIEKIEIEETGQMADIVKLFSLSIKDILLQLNKSHIYNVSDPQNISPFGLLEARKKFLFSPAGRDRGPLCAKILAICNVLISLAHAMSALKIHGVRPFYSYIKRWKDENNSKKGKYVKMVLDNPNFNLCCTKSKELVQNDLETGHQKLDELVNVAKDFFESSSNSDSNSNSKIIVFTSLRTSASEIVRILSKHSPLLRPHAFIGQAKCEDIVDGASIGMTQKEQQRVIEDFKKGSYNILVATSIGEEGLDIGEVDLIVCTDSNSSPLKMVQRMGRTGRKSNGKVVALLTKSEIKKWEKAMDNHKWMQNKIASGDRFMFKKAPRIIPINIIPTFVETNIEIPKENLSAVTESTTLSIKNMQKKTPKTTKKKASRGNPIPDGAKTGFIQASLLEEFIKAPKKKRKELEKEKEKEMEVEKEKEKQQEDEKEIFEDSRRVDINKVNNQSKLNKLDSDSDSDFDLIDFSFISGNTSILNGIGEQGTSFENSIEIDDLDDTDNEKKESDVKNILNETKINIFDEKKENSIKDVLNDSKINTFNNIKDNGQIENEIIDNKDIELNINEDKDQNIEEDLKILSDINDDIITLDFDGIKDKGVETENFNKEHFDNGFSTEINLNLDEPKNDDLNFENISFSPISNSQSSCEIKDDEINFDGISFSPISNSQSSCEIKDDDLLDQLELNSSFNYNNDDNNKVQGGFEIKKISNTESLADYKKGCIDESDIIDPKSLKGEFGFLRTEEEDGVKERIKNLFGENINKAINVEDFNISRNQIDSSVYIDHSDTLKSFIRTMEENEALKGVESEKTIKRYKQIMNESRISETSLNFNLKGSLRDSVHDQLKSQKNNLQNKQDNLNDFENTEKNKTKGKHLSNSPNVKKTTKKQGGIVLQKMDFNIKSNVKKPFKTPRKRSISNENLNKNLAENNLTTKKPRKE